jgi:hypothetical protein
MDSNAHRDAGSEGRRPARITRRKITVGILLAGALTAGVLAVAAAQQPQIPTLQVADETKVTGDALVKIVSRSDMTHSGSFEIRINVQGIGPAGYPTGTLVIQKLSMNDSTLQGTIKATLIEQVTSTGRATPMAFLNGRCDADGLKGGRFWMMITDNAREPGPKATPDIVSFLIFDKTGKRVAYGTGPVVRGNLTVAPTPN